MDDTFHLVITDAGAFLAGALFPALMIWSRFAAKEGDSREIAAYLQRYDKHLIEAKIQWFGPSRLGRGSTMMRIYAVVAEDAEGRRSERILGIDPLGSAFGGGRVFRKRDFIWEDVS